jgi:hypothetical protein
MPLLCVRRTFGRSQLFDQMPTRYRFQFDPQAQVFFTGGSLSNASQCCMPDLDVLQAKLDNATMISVVQPGSRSLTVDNRGYIAAIEDMKVNISRFHPLNLALIDRTAVSSHPMRSITYFQNALYVGTDANTVEVMDSNTLNTIDAIIHPSIGFLRDIMFLHGDDTMVVSSTFNNLILFFNQYDHSLLYQIPTSYSAPHGLARVNDSFFYATSCGLWTVREVISGSIHIYALGR